MLITAEKEGLHTNDEAYKMALTDALSVAMKAIGVGADVYLGRSPTKYASPPPSERLDTSPPEPGMPVPPTTQIGAAIKAQHSADQWASRDDEEHVLRDQIIKEARVQKEGTKRDGAPWTMYAITLGDGTTLSTFSRRVYELAQAAAETGDKVWVRYKTDPKGRVTVIDAGFPEISTPDLEPIPF